MWILSLFPWLFIGHNGLLGDVGQEASGDEEKQQRFEVPMKLVCLAQWGTGLCLGYIEVGRCPVNSDCTALRSK